MEYDFTVTFAVILCVSSVVSPIVVAIINNKHTEKMKRIEFYINNKINALEGYTSSLMRYINYPDTSEKTEYGYYLGKAIMYVPETTSIKMLELDKKLNKNSALNKSPELMSEALNVCLLIMREAKRNKNKIH